MTEGEWLTCADPIPMLEFLSGKTNDRKVRLFGCACVRRIWHLLVDERIRRTVEVSERYADGLARSSELMAVRRDSLSLAYAREGTAAHHEPIRLAAEAAIQTGCWTCCRFAAEAVGKTAEKEEQRRQCALLRDVFGNIFGSQWIDAGWLAWNGSTVRLMAQSIYNERAFDLLPILADALEEAGCTFADILSHLRGRGPHVRGCWALDRILERR
jgi:hypothetical protein